MAWKRTTDDKKGTQRQKPTDRKTAASLLSTLLETDDESLTVQRIVSIGSKTQAA